MRLPAVFALANARLLVVPLLISFALACTNAGAACSGRSGSRPHIRTWAARNEPARKRRRERPAVNLAILIIRRRIGEFLRLLPVSSPLFGDYENARLCAIEIHFTTTMFWNLARHQSSCPKLGQAIRLYSHEQLPLIHDEQDKPEAQEDR